MVNQFQTLSAAIDDLRNRGYIYSFKIDNDGALCIETMEFVEPEDMTLVEYHRFEGQSSEDDMAVVYAVESTKGLKGIIIDAYGTYANPNVTAFLKKVKMKEGLS